MIEKQYCPFCGNRLLPEIGSQTVFMPGTGTVTFRYYHSDSTEPACFGNCQPQDKVKVPRAFQEAFAEGELDL